MRFAILLIGAIAAVPAFAQDDEGFAGTIKGVLEEAIRPGFADYAMQTSALVPAVETLCAEPSEQALAASRSAFANTLASWSRVEFIRFGPTIVDDRLERTLFWPDPKGIGLRQVQAVLAQEPADAINPDSLANKSVALQGLAALEFVLHGTGAEGLSTGEAPYRCAYANAISVNLDTIAADMAAEWAADDLTILNPGPDNAVYRDDAEALLEVVQALTTGYEAISYYKLRSMIGESLDKARPRRAVFRRSQQTVAVLRENMEGLGILWQTADFADLLVERGGDPRIIGSIEFELANADRALATLSEPIEQTAISEEGWGSLNYLSITLASLRGTVGDRLTAELGLTLGFNSMDGD